MSLRACHYALLEAEALGDLAVGQAALPDALEGVAEGEQLVTVLTIDLGVEDEHRRHSRGRRPWAAGQTRRHSNRWAMLVDEYWILDPDAERIECLRLEGSAYRVVADASAPETLAHPDWPGLAIHLGALWR